ncbi:hypothetical protein DL95DRAFT_390303, partial [Leptodontidium sp. 2 PMI_412]
MPDHWSHHVPYEFDLVLHVDFGQLSLTTIQCSPCSPFEYRFSYSNFFFLFFCASLAIAIAFANISMRFSS